MVNDSAGTDVILVDKSQRPAAADGFKAAIAMEAERGLCNKPTFITSSDDFVKVFGNPAFDKYGQANLEAYFLAQRNVPMVISRAKNPGTESGDLLFGCMRATIKNGKLFIDPNANGRSIATPAEPDTSLIFFKGEGTYCSKNLNEGSNGENYSNIVLRFSEPQTKSAYADEHRGVQLQVYDFAGAPHIDRDTPGILGLKPGLDAVLGGGASGDADILFLKDYDLSFTAPSDPSIVTAFVNGCKGTAVYEGGSIYKTIEAAVLAARDPSTDKPVLTAFRSNGNGTFTVPVDAKFNCFNLSISISITAHAVGTPSSPTGKTSSANYNYGCGTVVVVPVDDSVADVTFTLSTSLYLENRKAYMFMGDENAIWAAYYGAYLKESFIVSFGYNDYDPSYMPMQIDTVLASSNYLVARTSEDFGDYKIDFQSDVPDPEIEPVPPGAPLEPSLFIKTPQYFDGDNTVVSNLIDAGQRSYAYATALRQIMGENLIQHKCVVTPNLGDVMNVPDFIDVIESAGETTLGLSNMGKAASLSVFDNLGGRHGNRFIADFSQYGRRIVNGRRMWLTFAALTTLCLNNNFKNKNEARPPMGISYGQILCDELSQEFTGPRRKELAETYKINPAMADAGFYLWAETTSQLAETSLSDTHVILSYCWMKYMLYQSMRPFVAEYNDVPTVNEGLRVLKGLNQTFKDRNYIEEGKPNADKNIIGDKVMRFDFPVRFKGVANFVDIYVTAYPQTQSLEISLAEDA